LPGRRSPDRFDDCRHREGEMMTDDPPPEGGKAAKLMWSALDEELRREVEEEGQAIETRHLIVRRLTAKALAGDIHAIKEIRPHGGQVRIRRHARRRTTKADVRMEGR